MILPIMYVVAQMLSDIMSLRIISLFGLSMDAGTLVYPITFTLRDLVHKKLGKFAAKQLIVIAAIVNIVMAIAFWITSVLPPDISVGLQSEFGIVLTPAWRIVLASIIAEVLSEFLDTEAYSIWQKRFAEKHQWARVFVSNSASIPVDTFTFCILAFYGSMPFSVVLSIITSNIILKVAIMLISIPSIYLVKEKENDK